MTLTSTSRGFTLAEMLIAVAVTTIVFAAIFTAATALSRSYAAVDDYFSTHMQQIRIIDYLARDVKRSFSVTTSPDRRTVTCIMPKYVVDQGDPEAIANPATIGTRRLPVLSGPLNFNKAVVDYRVADRSLTDGATVLNSATLTSNTAQFTVADIGRPITGTGIPRGATITARNSASSATMSVKATRTGSPISFTIYADGVRTVSNAQTTAGSTQLKLPDDKPAFVASDAGKTIVGGTIAAGATITSYSSPTLVTMSAAASSTGNNQAVTIGGSVVVYALVGNTITRTQDGVVTMIASSTDNLIPDTVDTQLSNTEYTSSSVTFQPIFTLNGTAVQRSGTTVFSTAFLRNRRRGN